MCQNGLSPAVVVKTESGVNNVALPAVPLPESVARSLSSKGAPFNVSAKQLPPGSVSQAVPVTTSSPAGGAQAPTPNKPFFRPFGLSPPPPSNPSGAPPIVPGSCPPPTSLGPPPNSLGPRPPHPLAPPPGGHPGGGPPNQLHPAYRHPFNPPFFPSQGYHPFSYPAVSSAAPTPVTGSNVATPPYNR